MSGARFKYTALDARGSKVHGAIWGESTAEVHGLLQQQGLAPIRLAKGSATDRRSAAVPAGKLAEFLHDLGALVGAGATLSTALAMYRHGDHGSARLTRLSEDLERAIAGGRPVSDAFRTALAGASPFVPALVAAGESSGALAGALQAAGQQIERDEALKSEFWASVSYPIFILASSVVAILLLLFVVIPSIAPLVGESGADAPVTLRVMIAVSTFLTANWPVILIGGLIVFVGALAAWRVGLLQTVSDRFVLDGPFSAISRRLIYGRFAGVFGRLLASGVPALEALGLASAAIGHRLAQARVSSCSTAIYDGARVSQALAGCKGLPGGITRMAAVGEETGSLGPMIERAARIEQEAATRAMSALTKWLAPVMIVLLGAMIGMIMGGLLTGVSSLGDTVLSES